VNCRAAEDEAVDDDWEKEMRRELEFDDVSQGGDVTAGRSHSIQLDDATPAPETKDSGTLQDDIEASLDEMDKELDF